MASQVDLDQGGTNRAWVNQWMGPSVGWVRRPMTNVFPITVAGTYNLDLSTTLVTVNVAGAVTINLPKATNPAYAGAPMTQPGFFADNPITIVDIGGNASAHPITINPAAGENIMALSTLSLSVNYGGYTLLPVSSQQGWESISP